MIAACRKADRKLMIAYRCRLEPTNLRAIELIRQGYVGTVQTIHSADGFNIAPGEWRFNKKMAGGGPLMDVGIYQPSGLPLLDGRGAGGGQRQSPPSSTVMAASRRSRKTWCGPCDFPPVWSPLVKPPTARIWATRFRASGSKGWIDSDPAFIYDGLHLRGQGRRRSHRSSHRRSFAPPVRP